MLGRVHPLPFIPGSDRMQPADWKAEAKRAANHFRANHFSAHRGAMHWNTLGVCVAFGNDGYDSDDGAKREVELVRGALAKAGISELGFGLSDEDRDTWAMIVQTDRADELSDVVWDAWDLACGKSDKLTRAV